VSFQSKRVPKTSRLQVHQLNRTQFKQSAKITFANRSVKTPLTEKEQSQLTNNNGRTALTAQVAFKAQARLKKM